MKINIDPTKYNKDRNAGVTKNRPTGRAKSVPNHEGVPDSERLFPGGARQEPIDTFEPSKALDEPENPIDMKPLWDLLPKPSPEPGGDFPRPVPMPDIQPDEPWNYPTPPQPRDGDWPYNDNMPTFPKPNIFIPPSFGPGSKVAPGPGMDGKVDGHYSELEQHNPKLRALAPNGPVGGVRPGDYNWNQKPGPRNHFDRTPDPNKKTSPSSPPSRPNNIVQY